MAGMFVCNLVTAFLSLLVGGSIAYTSFTYGIEMTIFGPGPGFWPFLLGMGLIVVAALIAGDTLLHAASYREQQVTLALPENFGVYRMMAVTGVYIALIFAAGFYIATFLFLAAAMRLLGERRIGRILTVTVLFLAFVYVLFGMLLHISLPAPFFLE